MLLLVCCVVSEGLFVSMQKNPPHLNISKILLFEVKIFLTPASERR